MADKNQPSNGANNTGDIDSQSCSKALIGPYLNADGLLNQPLPQLKKGKFDLETVTHAPRISQNYDGPLAKWDNFKKDVLSFYKNARTKAELGRCANVPIYMDPAVERINSEAMTHESIQCGAEITISGRFFHNALAAITAIVRTLVVPAHGLSANSDFLPQELAFGDSWILDRPYRVSKQEPDVFLKLPIEGKDQVRLVGELKFCLTVDLKRMLQNQERTNTKKFRGILGQLVNYMLGHKLKYAFISNYDETIFVQLDQRKKGEGEACIYYSDIIRFDEIIDNPKESVSLRLALFYLIYKTCPPGTAEWRIPETINTSNLAKKWISMTSVTVDKSATPYGSRVAALNDAALAIRSPFSTHENPPPLPPLSPLTLQPLLPLGSLTPQTIPPPETEIPLRPRPQPDRVLRSHRDRP